MTVIDTIITCALFIWNELFWTITPFVVFIWNGLCWFLSCTWNNLQIARAFFMGQPPNVQIALFTGFVLVCGLLFVICCEFHDRFLAIPDNVIWIKAVQITMLACSAGSAFHTSTIFAGEGFMGFFEHGWNFLQHALMFLVGMLGFIVVGFALPFIALTAFLHAVCAIGYGLALAVFEPERMLMTLEPSHNIAFRRAAGLSVPEQAPQSARHEQAYQSARHEQAPQAARPTRPEQAPPRRARPASGPTRYDGPVRNRPARPTPSRYSPALDPEFEEPSSEFEELRPSSAYRCFNERD